MRLVVLTTSYPRSQHDAEGHFVGAEVRRLLAQHEVTVLAPGDARPSIWGERVISLGGSAAFGFPGALSRLRAGPRAWLAASEFCWNARAWLGQAPSPDRLLAHFLIPCGVPLATAAARASGSELEVVIHGSDGRLLARSPVGRAAVGARLIESGASLRFVSNELRELVLGCLPAAQQVRLRARSRVEPCAIDVTAPSRLAAREELGIAAEERVALVVARLVASKRVDVALAACERVRGLSAVVVGDGPERSVLSQRFPRATFVGHVERRLALTYVAAADVLVSASLEEGAPTVVREARALGTQVVCLEAGDLRRWAERDPGIVIAS